LWSAGREAQAFREGARGGGGAPPRAPSPLATALVLTLTKLMFIFCLKKIDDMTSYTSFTDRYTNVRSDSIVALSLYTLSHKNTHAICLSSIVNRFSKFFRYRNSKKRLQVSVAKMYTLP